MAAYGPAIKLQDPGKGAGPRKAGAWGVAYHTTGSSLPKGALAKGEDPFKAGIAYYRKYDPGGPTYLIGYEPGQIAMITADENLITWHAGTSNAATIAANKDGSWRQKVSPATVFHWERVYGVGKNPYSVDGTTRNSVLPSASPNDNLIGVEMIPVTDGSKYWGTPMRPGLRFSKWQHDAARDLAKDLARRWGWPPGWQDTRILSHEAVNPIERYDSAGGWDPGWIRAVPFFDMRYVQGKGITLGPFAVIGLGILIGAVGYIGVRRLNRPRA